MNKAEILERLISDWTKKNAIAPAAVVFNCIQTEDLYFGDDIGIAKYYYQTIIPPHNSRTGQPIVMMYAAIELLDLDSKGNIVSTTPIDYQFFNDMLY